MRPDQGSRIGISLLTSPPVIRNSVGGITMSPKTFVGASLLALGLDTCLPMAATAQGVGAIGGTLSDASGAVLPGVNVALVNPGTIGGNQEAVTSERGTYQFTR